MSDSVMSYENGLAAQTVSVIPLEGGGNNVIPFDENCYSNLRLRTEWQRWLAQWDFELAVTLTYGHDVRRKTARRDLQHFNERLRSKLFSKKRDQYLSFVGFLESTKSDRPHWHLLFEGIKPRSGENLEQAMGRLLHFIKRVWLRMGNTPSSEAGFHSQPVYAKAGAIDYGLKDASFQRNFDFVEIDYLASTEKKQILDLPKK